METSAWWERFCKCGTDGSLKGLWYYNINYDLLIAKFKVYGFGKNALDVVYSYLKYRK